MNIQNYPHKIQPFNHQKLHLENNLQKKSWGLLWEQGTAKTKPIIDTAALLYEQGEIDGLVVVAPPGVERNWKSDEIPKHLPDEYALDVFIQIFSTAKKHNLAHKRNMDALLRWKGLAIFLISYPAFMTNEGKAMVEKFLQKRQALMVLDESHAIKSPGAKTTMSLIAKGRRAKYKRILTGTPMATGPFDLYSQIRFLDEFFWKNKGIHGSVEFRQFFGRFYTRLEHLRDHGYDPGYDQFIEYQNLDKLKAWLKEISDRITKDEVLDLPPKLYSKKYFELSNAQKQAYHELEKELIIEVGENYVTAELPIVLLLRKQQIACNYVPVGEDEPVHMFTKTNPRIGAMLDVTDQTSHQGLIWAKFRHDVDQIMDALGDRAVRYDGSVDEDEAERNKKKFQNGEVQWFVGTAAKGGPGLTLHQAKTVIYYSNSFKLIDRLQSEDRAHRAGMDSNPVNYVDLVAANVDIDNHIVKNLRGKKDVVADIQGDAYKEWI